MEAFSEVKPLYHQGGIGYSYLLDQACSNVTRRGVSDNYPKNVSGNPKRFL